ncbi:MAG: UPF0182 family protein [Prochloraceae cyanobacterium]|nr:UPF0182 family protein [Prochloraceae cyanobacterium]
MFKLFSKQPIDRILLIVLAIAIALMGIVRLTVEVFWFQELGYLNTFLKRLFWQLSLWFVATGFSTAFLLVNLRLAANIKSRYIPRPKSFQSKKNLNPSQSQKLLVDEAYNKPRGISLGLYLLLPIVVILGIWIGLIVIYYGQEALRLFQPDYTIFKVKPPILFPFEINSLSPKLWTEVSNHTGQIIGLITIFVLVLFNPLFWLRTIACLISGIFGLLIAGNWTKVLLFFNGVPFDRLDPIFKEDVGFYMFQFPLQQLFDFWLGGLFGYALVAVSLIYVLSANSLSEGKFPGFSINQQRHLYGLGGLVMFAIALHHWLKRYELLYSSLGVVYGAGYTDVKVRWPLEVILAIIATVTTILFLLRVKRTAKRRSKKNPFQRVPYFLIPLGLYLITTIGGNAIAQIVQVIEVQPNELRLESPYIENSVNLTREGFKLDRVDVVNFQPEGILTAEELIKNNLTIENIRLWDTRPLLQTNRQLQQIRLYYRFPDADIDRYTLKVEPDKTSNSQSDPNLQQAIKQQVIIAARELDFNGVPTRAQTWINKHLVYTHGYGFTLSPVNKVNEESGLPEYYVKDIGKGIENAKVNIPIGKPRIYYGEITDNYALIDTRVKELDFPEGEDNAYNTYDGTGGVAIGSIWRRIVFAQYLQDWRMLFSRNLTPDTKILFRRQITERVRAIAPFLSFDRDPYLVVGDGKDVNQGGSPNYLHWIIDAYTIGDRYPYSDPGENKFNYIRNSIKIVVDAYNGDVEFYVAEPDDPIIQAWQKIFPGLFKPLDEMPSELLAHIRYPEDLFDIQSERLLTYHMRDPRVFYNREDQWQNALEIYGTELQKVKPYYLIMKLPKLPTATTEEFILVNLYTPRQRNNLIAMLFGRSDGEDYGKLLSYKFPKQTQIFGPEQIDARINQNPAISERISLWNRQGSRVVQGNLLVIPVENSLIYVEPLYLEAERNSLPTLARVIVVYENRIVMAETLSEALERAIFQAEETTTPPVTTTIDETPPVVESGLDE